MTRFLLWLLINAGGIAGVAFGLNSMRTAVSCAFFSGFAFCLHWLFGEKA